MKNYKYEVSSPKYCDIIEVYGDGKSLKFNSDFTNINAVERKLKSSDLKVMEICL